MCKLQTIKHHEIHKVGKINKNRRIWIANQNILKSFNIGDTINITYNYAENEIIVNDAELLSNHSISSRENSKGKTPILDIKNSNITKTFEGIEKVEVLYYENKIVIRATKNEQARLERKSKSGLNMFEMFCGGGTLTHFFKKAGFVSRGGLERDSRYLNMFQDNNSETIHTILSSIEDIHPSDYPKDIDLLLSGIPCTDFTNANKALNDAQRRDKKGVATENDLKLLARKEESDALTFHVLTAIKAMNPKTIVVEEVVGYSKSESSQLLRTVLKQMGYILSEAIDKGTHTNRNRWVLIAHMGNKINLNNLIPETVNTIDKMLDVPVEKRNWKRAEEIPTVIGAKRKSAVGCRAKRPNEITHTNTFATHSTRHNEPSLKHPTEDLYDVYTNKDIYNIHGLDGYKLSGVKTVDRQVIGQGVCDMFYYVAQRVMEKKYA